MCSDLDSVFLSVDYQVKTCLTLFFLVVCLIHHHYITHGYILQMLGMWLFSDRFLSNSTQMLTKHLSRWYSRLCVELFGLIIKIYFFFFFWIKWLEITSHLIFNISYAFHSFCHLFHRALKIISVSVLLLTDSMQYAMLMITKDYFIKIISL